MLDERTDPRYRARNLRSLLLEVGREPFKTLEETVTRGGAGGLDVLGLLAFIRNKAGSPARHTQVRARKLVRPSLSVISAAAMAFLRPG